ncbi:hypothetical protein BLOT_001527 [Blomia tropicalis]|nr:hypothetical protein BLOT_001527 [Blomia tropicalis]
MYSHQMIEQFCSSSQIASPSSDSSATTSNSTTNQMPDNSNELNLSKNSNTFITNNNNNNNNSKVSQEVSSNQKELNNQSSVIESPLKRSILYEHLLKEIPASGGRTSLKQFHSPSKDDEDSIAKKLITDKYNYHYHPPKGSTNEYGDVHDSWPRSNNIETNIMNLSTKSSIPFGTDEDGSAPLNLSVKRTSNSSTTTTATSSSTAAAVNLSQTSNSQTLASKLLVNNLVAANNNNHSNSSSHHQNAFVNSLFSQQLQQQQQQAMVAAAANSLSSLMPQPKKRGRKPKSFQQPHHQQQQQQQQQVNDKLTNSFHQFSDLTAAMNQFMAAGASSLGHNASTSSPSSDIKPRKRGRPPTLSPPHSSLIAAHAAAAAAGSFPNSQNPFDIFNKLQQNKDMNPFNNLNLLNSNLFNNLKNFQSPTNEQFNIGLSKSSKSNERRQQQNHPQTSTPKEATESPSSSSRHNATSDVGNNTATPKGSFAHKQHSNEKQLRIPLNHGWKRLTFVSSLNKNGTIDGCVNYIAPCGKKVKNHPELIKYLTKNSITSMTRDNFSFDTNNIVGQFIETIQGSEMLLNENQMKAQLEELNKIRNFGLPSTSSSSATSSSSSNQNNMYPEKKRRVRDSGSTRNIYDNLKMFQQQKPIQQQQQSKNIQPHEPSITITLQNQSKGSKRKTLFDQNRAEMIRAEKLLKKQEEERQLRELREKQEEERKLKEAQERERQLELQKQEEAKLLAEIERERANQHQMFIHAFTELIAAEEREMKKEIMLIEKTTLQDRKILKKAIEMELIRELKKPTEDMLWKDHKELPTLNRIPGLKLTGKAFADTLMVIEFLYNFGETIGFDTDSLPNLNTFMMALLNLDTEAEEELISIVVHLVVCAIEDPGLPSNITTALGQKLKDATVTGHNLSEILRLYFQSFSSVVLERDIERRVECKIYKELSKEITFLALNATSKLDILVFLCNELLCNQAIVKQIDDNIESVATYKRDKWALELEIRKFRLVKMKRERIAEIENAKIREAAAAAAAAAALTSENGDETNTTAESDNEESSSMPSSVPALPPIVPIGAELNIQDDLNMTNEEIDKKIDKLNKQCNQMNNKLNRANNSYRVFPLGQDRYRRQYWILPSSGGVFVEGMESAEPSELENNIIDENQEFLVYTSKCENDDEPMEDDEEETKPKIDMDCDVKDEEEEEEEDSKNPIKFISPETSPVKEEQIDNSSEDKPNVQEPDNVSDTIQDGENISMKCKNDEEEEEEEKQQQTIDNEDEIDDQGDRDTENSSLKCDSSSFKDDDNTTQPETDDETATKWFDMIPTNCCINNQKLKKNGLVSKSELNEDDDGNDDDDDDDDDDDESKDKDKTEVDDSESLIETDCDIQLYRQLEKSLSTFFEDYTMKCLFGGVEKCIDTAILKGTLLRILSAFPKSAVTTEYPNSELVENEIVICPTLQKRIQEWKELQYESPLKIGREFQVGWWRITDPTQLKSMLELFHENASRERNLQKHLERHLTYAMQSCKSSAANLEVTDFDRELSESREHGAPTENRCPHQCCQIKGYCYLVSLVRDVQVFELIEAFEEKIISSSMQARNWKSPSALMSTAFRERLSNFIGKAKTKSSNNKKSKSKNVEEQQKNGSSNWLGENNENSSSSYSDEMERFEIELMNAAEKKLLQVERIIERRYLKPPLGFKNANMIVSSDPTNDEENNEYGFDDNIPAGLSRWRDAVIDASTSSQMAMCLHFLETCIAWDKSIMRASCQFCGSGENEAQLLLCDLCDKGYHMYCFKPKMENVPSGDWFCFDCQNKNTIDKVCIVCGKKGKLLNCDTCAKAYHPNCLATPMTKQLKGRWICHLCQRKNKRQTNNSMKISGGSGGGGASSKTKNSSNNHNSNNNNSTSHSDKDKDHSELNSSTTATTKSDSSNSRSRVSNGNKESKSDNSKDGKKESNSNSSSRKSKSKDKEEKEKNKKENDKNKNNDEKSSTNDQFQSSSSSTSTNLIENNEVEQCGILFEDMMNHESCWPFLEPVNTKHFPTYKKIIKKPMDLNIIKSRFLSKIYKSKEEFASDIRLMFDNCVTFNEDESPVGQAGHNLRAFFESKWIDLFGVLS